MVSDAAATDYPTSYGAYQSATAANNTISLRKNLAAGTGTYDGVRWGDYVGVAADPLGTGAAWFSHETVATGGGWRRSDSFSFVFFVVKSAA